MLEGSVKAPKLARVIKELKSLADAGTATALKKFFKTGPGQYGEGDLFRGIRVPALRRLAIEHQGLSLAQVKKLLRSVYHEDRLLALLILSRAFSNGDDLIKEQVYDLYLKNTRIINNWDLVDASAPNSVGAFLWDRDREVLSRLARSKRLWERRIAIISTLHFIKRNEFGETLKVAEILMFDREDLIHKGGRLDVA